MAGSDHLTSKPGFELVLLLTRHEETSKNTGESDEYETMNQVGTGK